MDLQVKDQVALVAGSSRGIGKAIARGFLEEGGRVVLTGRDGASLLQTTEELQHASGVDRILAWQGDLTLESSPAVLLAMTLARWGRLDHVVANLGSGKGRLGWELEAKDWHGLFDANLFGSTNLVNGLLPHLIHAGRGSVLFLASIAALEALPAPLPYSAAKAALVNYSKNLARAVAHHGVRVNCLAPGNVFFPGGSWERHLQADPEAVNRYLTAEVPLQRFGRPEEIADLAVFLCSARASFITGACVVADGGQSRGM